FFFYCLSYCGCHRLLQSCPTRRSSDLVRVGAARGEVEATPPRDAHVREAIAAPRALPGRDGAAPRAHAAAAAVARAGAGPRDTPDRKSTRLNSSHVKISYAVFCLKKKN